MKKSKLAEKASRIPDISEQDISQKFKEYIEQVSQLNTESARAQRFIILLKDVFGDVEAGFIEDYLHGVEKHISTKKKDIILRGRIDALYGNLIIEFERDLKKKLGEALDQLKRYVILLQQAEEKTSYLCLATDGILLLFTLRRLKAPKKSSLRKLRR
ncbi:MAG: hypothetical protein C0415_04120 [Thermodesulfovibrio sp.]|nr:hypothetical protein [Thermodesulfovibrio sp.]